MSTSPTNEQIAKLPKWASDHIKDLERQRDAAVRALDAFTDESKPSAFYVERMDCTSDGAPTLRQAFIQTRTVYATVGDITVRVHINDGGPEFEKGVIVSASTERITDSVVFNPASRNTMLITSKDLINKRK